MIDRCRRFWRLSRTEQQLFLQGVALLPLIAFATKLFGFSQTQRYLSHRAGGGSTSQANHDSVSAVVARTISAAARYGPWRANCLQHSLLLWWLLRRRGIAGDLRIGVCRVDRKLQAHAWVEHGGRVLNARDDVGAYFTAFDQPIHPVGAEID